MNDKGFTDYKVDFIGIGSAKSGSSWLGVCLAEHPQINLAKDKSLFFFNSEYGNDYIKDNWSNWGKGIDWYLSKLPPVEEGKIRGEFGVSYLHDKEAPERIKKLFPNTKILVTLRNPVNMLYSLYWYSVNTVEQKAPESFVQAVKQKWCIDRGNYYKYLCKYFEFFPRDNIHITLLYDIMNSPEQVVSDLYKFLGVDQNFRPQILNEKVYEAIGHKSQVLKDLGGLIFEMLRKLKLDSVRRILLDNPVFYNIYSKINVVQKKYPPMDPKLREKLTKYYEPDIHKLEKLIGRDLSFWL